VEERDHEQQPILKPADPDGLIERRVSPPSIVPPSASDAGDTAFEEALDRWSTLQDRVNNYEF